MFLVKVFGFVALQMVLHSPANSESLDNSCYNGKSISITWWIQEPYFKQITSTTNAIPEGLMSEILATVFEQCCLRSFSLKFESAVDGPQHLQQILDEGSFEVLAPVPVSSVATTVQGYPFIGIIESPSVAVLRKANVNGIQLVLSVLKAWPLLVFIIVSAALAGILMWVLEKNENTEQFPQAFAQGSFEGFWWAFVTMTTVGYGDRAPSTIPGKLLGIVWMLIGLIITTMFISIITSALSATSLDAAASLVGLEVAAFNGSEEFRIGVRENGIVKVYSTDEEISSEMIKGRVDAAVVDIHSIKYYTSKLTKHNIQVVGTIDNQVYYGVLLGKNCSRLEQCFRRYLQMEEDSILAKTAQHTGNIQIISLTPAEDYFGSGGVFAVAVYGGLSVFVVLFTMGMIWHTINRRKKKPGSNADNQSDRTNGYVTYNQQMNGAEMVGGQSKQNTEPTPRLNFGEGRTEKLLSRQSMEVLHLEEQLETYARELEQRYRSNGPRETGHEGGYGIDYEDINSSSIRTNVR